MTKKLFQTLSIIALSFAFCLFFLPLSHATDDPPCTNGDCPPTEPPCTNGDCPPTEPPCTNGDCPPNKPANKIGICHYPLGNPTNYHTIWINEKALKSHLAHGDDAMPCEEGIDPDLCEYTVQMCVPVEGTSEGTTMDVSLCDVPTYRDELLALDGPCFDCQ